MTKQTWRRRTWEAALKLLSSPIGTFLERPLDLSKVEKILILQLQQLGDSVVFTPTLRAIREQFPLARIDMLCSSVSLELYRKCPYLAHRYLYASVGTRWHRGIRLFSLMREIRETSYDLVIADVTHTALWYGTAAWLAGGRRRLGFDVDHRGFLFTNRLYPSEANFVDCNLQIARALGVRVPSATVECFFDEEDCRAIDALLERLCVPRRRIAIHAASNWQSKTWFPERWAGVADALVKDYDATVLFVGSRKEQSYIHDIMSKMKAPAFSIAGETSLSQLAALLTRCDLFIGTDSGPRHIAAAVGARQVTVMSSQDRPGRWSFDRQSEIVLRTDPSCSPCLLSYCSHRQCMEAISELEVLESCHALLHDRASSRAASEFARVSVGGRAQDELPT